MQFELEPLQLDLKVNWKLSRNETLIKKNYIFKVHDGQYEGRGEIAPNIRYHETDQKIQEDFYLFKKLYNDHIHLADILYRNNFCHSFQFAVDAAFTDLNATKTNQKIWQYLNLEKPVDVLTSYSVPIMELEQLDDYLKQLDRFKFIKIKVNQDNAIEFTKAIAKRSDRPLRIDGNEAWRDLDSYKKFEQEVKAYNIQFIEQPFPANKIDTYKELKKNSLFDIMADESIEQIVDFDLLSQQFDSINVKLMKAGGFAKAVDLIKSAKDKNMKVMLGCMIESSLGISYALNLSGLADYFDLDGSMLIKKDPFNLITESNGSLYLK